MMTPQQKLMQLILIKDAQLAKQEAPSITAENVSELYAQAVENDDDGLQDARNEVRCSGIDTELDAPYSRHYESAAVAAQAVDGSWVGWTYWYGGGKHGEPESIDWIEDAYDVACSEEEKLVVVRTFAKATNPASVA